MLLDTAKKTLAGVSDLRQGLKSPATACHPLEGWRRHQPPAVPHRQRRRRAKKGPGTCFGANKGPGASFAGAGVCVPAPARGLYRGHEPGVRRARQPSRSVPTGDRTTNSRENGVVVGQGRDNPRKARNASAEDPQD